MIQAPLASPRTVVVVGAGVVGACCAIEVAMAGMRVTLMDPAEVGGEQAASYGNACWLSSHSVIPPSEPGMWKRVPGYLADPLGPLSIRWSALGSAWWLARYVTSGATRARVARTAHALRSLLVHAPALHATLATDAGVPELIDRRGVLHVYRSAADFRKEAASWSVRRDTGIGWEELARDRLEELQPGLDPAYGFGVHVREAGVCRDPAAYVSALVRRAQAIGVDFVAAKAQRLRLRGRSLTAVVTDQGELPCAAVVIAAGVRSKSLARDAGDRIPLESERGYHAAIEAPGSSLRWSIMAADCKAVVTPMPRGVRIAGQVEIASLDAPPNWRRAEILREHLLRILPELSESAAPESTKFWMGHRPSTPDGLPCIGPSRDSPDVIHAFGHGHVGLVASARTGRLVAQLLAGRDPEIALAPFSPQRF